MYTKKSQKMLGLYSTDYVMATGKRKRSVQQCQDKLGYYTQKAKKKVSVVLLLM